MTYPTVIVEVGFTSPSTGTYLHLDDTSRGILDTATLAPTDLFVDVTQWASSGSIRRGATRADGPNLRYEAGTATIVLRNEDRRFDPTNLAGPYVSAGMTQVEPMRAVRIRATWNGITYPLFRGFADEWKVDYDSPNTSFVTLTCTDAFKVFSSYDRNAGAAVGSGDTSGARINRVLDSITWPAADRVIATGDSTLQSTTLADNTLSELLLTADSELGEFYVDAEGRATFRNRRAMFTDSRSNTSNATFGDQSPEFGYSDVQLTYDDQSIYNLISIARVGGTVQVTQGLASRDKYLTRTYGRSDLLLQTDAECADYAAFLIGQSRNAELRFSELILKPRGDPGNLFPQALGRQFGDRITVIRRPPGGGDPIQRDVFVRGVEHQFDTHLNWTTKFVLQSASRYEFMVLDHAVLGMLDSNSLAF